MSEWREWKLKDLGRIVTGKTPSTKDNSLYDGPIPFICIPDLGSTKRVQETNKTISEKGAATLKNLILPPNSVVVSCIATIGKVGITSTYSVTNQQINSIIPDPSKVNTDYLYYLISDLGENIGIYGGGGSVFNIISKSKFEEIPVTLPDLPTQTAIAEILSSLDDKIELNNRINAELEALAQALFKRWFVDFEFPNENGQPYKSSGGKMVESELGEIPEGWEVKKLSQIIKIIGGGTPKRGIPEYWGGDIHWFSVQDVPPASEVVVVGTKEKISLAGLNNSSTKILPVGTTIITARGTVGKLALVASPMAMNQSCYGMLGINGVGRFFNYLNLSLAVDELKRNTHGAVFDTITTTTFESIKTIMPDLFILDIFESVVSPIFYMFEENARENNQLTQLRDTLLPKLISGELDLKTYEYIQ